MKRTHNVKEVGFICSAWDLFHAGHASLLSWCKSKCDYLIVGLHTDPSLDRSEKNKPIQSVYERWVQLAACKYIDEIIPYDTEDDLKNMLGMVDIDIRFLGADCQDKTITGQEICMLRDIKIEYIPRLHKYSTSELRNRIQLNEGKHL